MKAMIAGAGIAGLSSALALHRAGWQVQVIEKAPRLRTGGYMLDFFGPGFDAADDLGVLDALRQRARDVEAVAFANGQGRVSARMDYRYINGAAGGRLFPILRGDIEQVLHDALPADVGIAYGTAIDAVFDDGDGVTVRLSNGREDRGNLLVGADGIHSGVRRLVFGAEERFLRPLGYHTAAYFCTSAAVARSLNGDFRMVTVRDRLVGLYEVEKDQIMVFLAMRAEGTVRPADPRPVLRAAFGDLGWVVPDVLAAAPEPGDIYYDVVAQVEMDRWHAGRTVLVGDAACAVSLMAGQGASLALAGGRALGQVLSGAEDVAGSLARYEQQLKPLVLEKQAAGRRTAHWFVPASSAHVVMRNMGVNMMNWPPLSGLIERFFAAGSKGFSLR